MDRLYTLKEACKILGITRCTLYSWEQHGKIKMVRIGERATRITGKELERIMKGE